MMKRCLSVASVEILAVEKPSPAWCRDEIGFKIDNAEVYGDAIASLVIHAVSQIYHFNE